MAHSFRLGKRPARRDVRIPMMSKHVQLPPPPDNVNWYSQVASWPMLLNDQYGDCVEAAVLHCIQQLSTYAGNPLTPVNTDALNFYKGATGFDPNDPSTDNGTYVMGPGGAIEYWHNHGVQCGSQLNKVDGFLAIPMGNMTHYKQGIYTFGGCLTGIQVPESLMAGPPPAIWSQFSGPMIGGHEIWIDGYTVTPTETLYDLISWGERFQATEEFLVHVMDEAVVVVDAAEINARGVDASGLSLAQLVADLQALSSNRGIA